MLSFDTFFVFAFLEPLDSVRFGPTDPRILESDRCDLIGCAGWWSAPRRRWHVASCVRGRREFSTIQDARDEISSSSVSLRLRARTRATAEAGVGVDARVVGADSVSRPNAEIGVSIRARGAAGRRLAPGHPSVCVRPGRKRREVRLVVRDTPRGGDLFASRPCHHSRRSSLRERSVGRRIRPLRLATTPPAWRSDRASR